ncbi:hypothetical protein HUJ04_013497 [Dendroctonus ponderosae]
MRWFSGISEGINTLKLKGGVFVVYIEGEDAKSQQLTALIESDAVAELNSDTFIAIKIKAESRSHEQFIELFQQTPVPSIYFIEKGGKPLKIVTEAPDATSLSTDIAEVLRLAGISASTSTSAATADLISNEQTASARNVVCENGVCTIKRDPPSDDPTSEGDRLAAEEKIERAKKLLEAKRLEKEKKEQEEERQRELERRRTGQEAQKMKKWQEDQELKQLKEEREKEKREEKEARDRVRAQIEQDKAERVAKFKPPAASTPTLSEASQPVAGPSTSRANSNTARLQFKLPDGSSKTQDFPSSDKLLSVLNFVKANFNLASKKFTLSTTFPRRQFSESDQSQTLAELQLTPNAVILVLPLSGGVVSTNQGVGGVSGFVWSLLTPLLGILNFIKAFLGFGTVGHVSGDQPGSSGGSSSNRSNSVVQVSSKYDLENRLKSAGSKLVVIDFFATWCGPCKMIAPELERMARDFPNVVFLKVDVDQNGDVSRSYGVSAMPTFVFLKNRREVSRLQGADSYSLRSTIQRYR